MSTRDAVLIAASNLAAAVLSRLSTGLPLDETLSAPAVQRANEMGYRLTHVFAHGFALALSPAGGWQLPDVGSDQGGSPQLGTNAQQLAQAVAAILNAAGVKPAAGPVPGPSMPSLPPIAGK